MIPLDGYQLGKCLGSTPRSEVYCAVREEDDRDVIVKIYRSPATTARDSRAGHEFEIISQIESQGVPRPLGLELSGDCGVLVLESFPGLDLDAYLDGKPLRLDRLLAIGTQLAETVADIHRAYVVHKDIKPANILVDPETLETRLIDFGIATCLGRAEPKPLRSARAEGTAAYLSPEQTGWLNVGIDFRSDLYSLGATLYHMATGQPPFDDAGSAAQFAAHLGSQPRAPDELRPQFPRTLSRIILRLLEKDPDRRYQTAFGLCSDLRECGRLLSRSGSIPADLVLGTRDASDRLRFCAKLYGREAEAALLTQSLRRVQRGRRELFLINGEAGIGKSALVQALREPVARAGGYLAQAKFDRDRAERPYAVFHVVLEALAVQLLTESKERLDQWAARLEAGLGQIAGSLSELVPSLALILDEIRPVPSLPPQETAHRLALAVRRFLGTIASAECPLILFFDDLQWSDPGSLYLIEELLLDSKLAGLLIVGTYRESEVAESHPMTHLLMRLEKSGAAVRSWRLAALDAQAVDRWIGDTLSRSSGDIERLCETVRVKTGNNPLALRQFLTHMYEVGAIRFEPDCGWTWDDEAIASADIPEDAAVIMAASIERLDYRARRVVKIASCIGDAFEASLVGELCGEPVPVIEMGLRALCERGLIAPCRDGFRFVHDRIREAAQSLWNERDRARLHHQIGTLLLGRVSEDSLRERVFEIVEHMNRAGDLIRPEQRFRLLELNLLAGKRALEAGAAASAEPYFAAGRALAHERDWELRHATMFDLYRRSADSALIGARYDEAEGLFDVLLGRPLSTLESAQIWSRRVSLLALQGRDEDAVKIGLEGLRRVGLRCSPEPTRLQIWIELKRTRRALRRGLSSALAKPARGDDPLWVSEQLLFSAMGTPVYRINRRMFCLIFAYSLRSSMARGFRNPALPLSGYAVVRATLGDYLAARFYAQRSLELRSRGLPQLAHRISTNVTGSALPWTCHRRSMLDPLLDAHEAALEFGDHEYALIASTARAAIFWLIGARLPTVIEAWKQVRARAERNGHGGLQGVASDLLGLLQCLANRSDASRREELTANDGRSFSTYPEQVMLAPILAGVLALIGRPQRAATLWVRLEPSLRERVGPYLLTPDFYFYQAVCAAASTAPASRSERGESKRILRSCLREIRCWARTGPENFLHQRLLLEALQSSARGRSGAALRLTARAAERAQAMGYRHHAALAHEHRSRLFAKLGRGAESQHELSLAIQLYREWGAAAKVDALTRERGRCV